MNENSGYLLKDIQLVYLYRMQKKGTLLGVSDPLRFSDDAEKAAAFASAEEELTGMGLLKPSFGGKVSVDPVFQSLFEVITSFEYYIGYDLKKPGSDALTSRYYYRNGTWALISDDEDGLSICYSDGPGKEIAGLPSQAEGTAAEMDVSITKRDLNDILGLIRSGQRDEAVKSLSALGWPDACIAAFLDSLTGSALFVSLTLATRDGDNVSADNASVIEKDGVLYEFYQTVNEDDRTVIGLKAAGGGEYVRLKEVAGQWSTM